jgi:hypothetical protein
MSMRLLLLLLFELLLRAKENGQSRHRAEPREGYSLSLIVEQSSSLTSFQLPSPPLILFPTQPQRLLQLVIPSAATTAISPRLLLRTELARRNGRLEIPVSTRYAPCSSSVGLLATVRSLGASRSLAGHAVAHVFAVGTLVFHARLVQEQVGDIFGLLTDCKRWIGRLATSELAGWGTAELLTIGSLILAKLVDVLELLERLDDVNILPAT